MIYVDVARSISALAEAQAHLGEARARYAVAQAALRRVTTDRSDLLDTQKQSGRPTGQRVVAAKSGSRGTRSPLAMRFIML